MPKAPKRKYHEDDDGERHRGWYWTYNNYTEAGTATLVTLFEAKKLTYLVFGKEIAPTTGTPHLQGYLYFKNECSWKVVKKTLIRQISFKPADGTPEENRTYCIKDGDFQEYGIMPKKGKRTDISDFGYMVQDAAVPPTRTALLTEHANLYARYPRYVEAVIQHFHPPPPLESLDNLWLHGVPGSGKTHLARSLGLYYEKDASDKWFCGYDNEPNVLIEEAAPIHGQILSFNLKKWADKHVCHVQTKFGSLKIRPKRIIVTSNYSIEGMGWDAVTTAAIKRRFTEKFFSKIYVPDEDSGVGD